MVRTATTKVTARERARAAKARVDAQRRDYEKAVEDGTVAFYEADDARLAAQDALAEAEIARAGAVLALLDLGESPDRVADLVDLTLAEVRKLRRTASNASGGDDDPTPADEAVEPDTAHDTVDGSVDDAEPVVRAS